MISALFDWLESHPEILAWAGVGSLMMFIGSLLLIPFLVSLIPHDYFAHRHREPTKWKTVHPLFRMTVLIVKNLLGWTLLLAGILMLVLPGQGLLSILIALIMMDYPGKYELERRIVGQPRLLHLINRLRTRRGKPDLVL